MYTEYNSQNVYQNYDNYQNNEDDKPNKFLSILWKILLVIIILIVLFFILIQAGILSFKSSVLPDAVILNQNEIGIKKGSGYQLISTVLPEEATNKQVIWESSDPSIVSVNEVTGYVEGVKEGSAVVTVKTLINEKQSECLVNVLNTHVLITGLYFNEKYISLAVGYTHYLTYRTTPSDATEINLKFTSSDPSVATVNEKGMVTGVKEGSAIITATSSNGLVKDTTYVTVYKKGTSTVVGGESISTNNYPESINIKDESINLTVGASNQLHTEVLPKSSNQKISWSSSNSSIATVNENGLVIAKKTGTTTIVAKTINGLTDSCVVTVGNYSTKVREIKITTDYSVLNIGQQKQLVVAFTPSNATNKTINWSSSNTNVVTVDSSGNVKAIGVGSAIITATSVDGNYKDTVNIEVTTSGSVVEETGIKFSSSSYTVNINGTIALNPTIIPSNASFKTMDFRSSDNSIATVDENGIVKGLKEGEVTITATTKRNNIKASVVVKVKKISVSGVKLDTSNITLNKNDTKTLIATILPANATNQKVTWSSSNTSVATVDENGIVKAIGVGTATITVTTSDGSKTSTCLVKVS